MAPHPDAAALLGYLARPSLVGWQQVRNMVIPRSGELGPPFGGPTVWQAVVEYGWSQAGGGESAAPWNWEDPRAYPDRLGLHPPPVVVEKAILSALGRPYLGEVESEAPLRQRAAPARPAPRTLPGPAIPLYYGENRQQRFWQGAPVEIGLRVLLFEHKREPGYWTVITQARGESPRVLTRRRSGRTTETVSAGGPTAAAALRDVARHHALKLTLSQDYHWGLRRGKVALVAGPWRGEILEPER
jgi:hypothetical protein